jgi:hypothetical protein
VSSDLEHDWERFTSVFFGDDNHLSRSTTDTNQPAAVEQLMSKNLAALAKDPPSPVTIPFVASSHGSAATTYFAIARSDQDASDLRRLLGSFVGPSYTNFDGRPAQPQNNYEPILEAAVHFAGSAERVFRFDVTPSSSEAKTYVRQQTLSLMRFIVDRPPQQLMHNKPVGRLLSEFASALQDQDEQRARNLRSQLERSGQISGTNPLFLHVRFLGAFHKWSELRALPRFNELLKVKRPSIVSDVLAELALREQSEEFLEANRKDQMEVFTLQIYSEFESLVPSFGRIRSPWGALYYVLSQLRSGSPIAKLRDRFTNTEWIDWQPLARLIEQQQLPSELEVAVSPESVLEAFHTGRFDDVIEALTKLPPREELLPILIQTAQITLSRTSFQVLDSYRKTFGDDAIERENARSTNLTEQEFTEKPRVPIGHASWPARIRSVLETNPEQLTPLVQEEIPVPDLVNDVDAMREIREALSNGINDSNAQYVIEAALALLSRLDQIAGDARTAELRELREMVILFWLLHEHSGSGLLQRVEGVIDQLEVLLQSGVAPQDFQQFANDFHERWDAFTSHTAFGTTMRLLEVLVASQPTESYEATAFAQSSFARLHSENLRHIDPVDLQVADSLARELGLELPVTIAENGGAPLSTAQETPLSVGIYSLSEAALRTAREIILSLHPDWTVQTRSDKVSSSELVNLTKTADLMLVVTGRAKHAATDAIRAAGNRDAIRYVSGNGSSSIVRALQEYLEEQLNKAAEF